MKHIFEFNSRGQMDLIDMQSLSYNDNRYIMVCQDHMTIFVVLWPLKSKRLTDVAMQILDIFLLFGAPNILPIFTIVFTHPCYGHISYICACPLNTSLALWMSRLPRVEAKVGLTSSSLPDEIISKISTEDDLKDITNTGFRND
jgi:hypothetical protein